MITGAQITAVVPLDPCMELYGSLVFAVIARMQEQAVAVIPHLAQAPIQTAA
jgi:hypothetical protein